MSFLLPYSSSLFPSGDIFISNDSFFSNSSVICQHIFPSTVSPIPYSAFFKCLFSDDFHITFHWGTANGNIAMAVFVLIPIQSTIFNPNVYFFSSRIFSCQMFFFIPNIKPLPAHGVKNVVLFWHGPVLFIMDISRARAPNIARTNCSYSGEMICLFGGLNMLTNS